MSSLLCVQHTYLYKGLYSAERQNCLLCGIPVYTKRQTRPMCQQHMNRQTEDTTGYATDVSVRVNKCQSVTKVQEDELYFCPNPQWHHNAHTHNEIPYLQVWRIYCRSSGSNLKVLMSDCNLYGLPKSTEPFSKCEGQLLPKYVPDTSTANCLGKQIMHNGINISGAH
jgi:hypothetical protein